MQPLRARVQNGRLKLDEPTDLPEGAEIDLLAIEDDGLDPEERAELHVSLDRALEDKQAGRMVDAWTYLKQYRAHRERDGLWLRCPAWSQHSHGQDRERMAKV
jgi:hypothetical protein